MTAASSDLRAWLAQLTDTHTAATRAQRFWERCGCFESTRRLNPDCHQAGLCAMRQRDRQRDDDFRRLVAALGAVLDRHHRIGEGEPGREIDYCDYDGFVWPCEEYRAVVAAAIEGAGQ